MHDFEEAARRFARAGISAQEASDNLKDFGEKLAEIDYASIEERMLGWQFKDCPSFDAAVFRAFSVKAPGGGEPSAFDLLYWDLGAVEEKEPDPLALSPLAEAVQGGNEQRSYLETWGVLL